MKNPLKTILGERRSAIRATQTELDAIREAVTATTAKIEEVENAGFSREEAVSALDIWLDRVATDAVDVLSPGSVFADAEASKRGPKLPIFNLPTSETLIPTSVRATEILLGLVVAAARPTIRQTFIDQIDDFLAARPGMSAADRAAALAAARAELHTLHAREEQIVRVLEDAGTTVSRRPEAPAAFWLATEASLERAAA